MRVQFVIILASILILGLVGTLDDAYAVFDLWDINEVFSNSDGTIQYVELFTTFNSQQFLLGHVLTATSDGSPVVFTFPSNSGAPTANQHILIATPAFSTIPGAPTPDYTIPAQFFDPNAASITINFAAGFDILTFSGPLNLPTDGINSLNRDLTTSNGSPTNFNGDTLALGIVSCGVPPLGLDWTITSRCTLASSVTANKDVIVQSGAVMIIPSGVILNIDFTKFNLTVEFGGGVLIQAGGKIT